MLYLLCTCSSVVVAFTTRIYFGSFALHYKQTKNIDQRNWDGSLEMLINVTTGTQTYYQAENLSSYISITYSVAAIR